jgi:hypothetical protein
MRRILHGSSIAPGIVQVFAAPSYAIFAGTSRYDKHADMDFDLLTLDERLPRDQRKIEKICQSFDMDCTDLNHEACWRGARGVMSCCGRVVEFERVRGICPFLWLKNHA